MVSIVRDKTDSDYSKIEQVTEEWMATDYFTIGREWVYKGLKRTILAEKLLLDENGQIPSDYKFFCFDGEVKIIQVDFNRFGNQKRNLYDRNFNQIEGQLLYPNFDGDVSKPAGLDQAIEIAESLSKEFSFIRVDLYIVNNHVYFGELTNYPGNGFINFRPETLGTARRITATVTKIIGVRHVGNHHQTEHSEHHHFLYRNCARVHLYNFALSQYPHR